MTILNSLDVIYFIEIELDYNVGELNPKNDLSNCTEPL